VDHRGMGNRSKMRVTRNQSDDQRWPVDDDGLLYSGTAWRRVRVNAPPRRRHLRRLAPGP
jgi:hypothetical protein